MSRRWERVGGAVEGSGPKRSVAIYRSWGVGWLGRLEGRVGRGESRRVLACAFAPLPATTSSSRPALATILLCLRCYTPTDYLPNLRPSGALLAPAWNPLRGEGGLLCRGRALHLPALLCSSLAKNPLKALLPAQPTAPNPGSNSPPPLLPLPSLLPLLEAHKLELKLLALGQRPSDQPSLPDERSTAQRRRQD